MKLHNVDIMQLQLMWKIHTKANTDPDSFKSFPLLLTLPQDVFDLPRDQDILFPPRHQPRLPSHARSWEEDRSGHRRGRPGHQPAGVQPGSPADPSRLPAADSPAQLQGAVRASAPPVCNLSDKLGAPYSKAMVLTHAGEHLILLVKNTCYALFDIFDYFS